MAKLQGSSEGAAWWGWAHIAEVILRLQRSAVILLPSTVALDLIK